MPTDAVNADLVLHDGERSTVVLFIHGGEDVPQLFSGAKRFVPVVRSGRVCLVARAAIASIAVPGQHAGIRDGDLPTVRQRVIVRLRSGGFVEGEVAWVPDSSRTRTADYLNLDAPIFTVQAGETTYFVAKEHVAMVSEA